MAPRPADRKTPVANKNCHMFGTVPGVLNPRTPTDLAARQQRARIVDALVESCAAKTFAATTISDIVARAHISRTTFYKHFPDKRACFEAAVDTCMDEVAQAAREAHRVADPPATVVIKATAAMLGLMIAKPALAQLLTGDAPAVDPAVVERYRGRLIPAVAKLWNGRGSAATHLDPNLAFGRAQVLIFARAGGSDGLAPLLPELVYLGVAPFAGHQEALEQARVAAAEPIPEPSPGR